MRTEIPIEIVELEGEGIHLFVKGNLNINTECNLIIDTGASKTVFDNNLSEEFFKIETTNNEMITAGVNAEQIKTQIGKTDFFSIGKLEIKNFESILIDLEHINCLYEKLKNRKIYGLIGSDFLMKYKANIDFRKKILSLEYKKMK